MRRLIVNADDFGLTAGVNRAIAEGHRDGLITSATLMANSRAFDDAVALAKRTPKLSVGCHVVLVDGEPVLPAEKVVSLLGAERGQFRVKLSDFAFCAMRWRLDEGEIEAEATAQIRKIQAAGLTVTHCDTHKHVHMFPPVLRPLLRAAKACGVRAVRNPFTPLKPLAFAHLARRPKLWTRYSEVKVLRRLGAGFRRAVEEAELATTDGTFGIVVTGAMDLQLFEAIVGNVPGGTWEFVCHPGYNDEDLGGVRTRLRASRVKELEVLRSKEARKAVERAGIEVISYAELA